MRLTLLPFHIRKMSSVRGDNRSRGRVDETTRYDSQQHENTRNHTKARSSSPERHRLPHISTLPPSNVFSRTSPPRTPTVSTSPVEQPSSSRFVGLQKPRMYFQGRGQASNPWRERAIPLASDPPVTPSWSSWGLATGRGSSCSGTCSTVILLPHKNRWYFNLKCKTYNHVEAIVAPQNGRIVCGHQLLPGDETNARRARWPHVALSTLDSLQPLSQEHRA